MGPLPKDREVKVKLRRGSQQPRTRYIIHRLCPVSLGALEGKGGGCDVLRIRVAFDRRFSSRLSLPEELKDRKK